ncbi:hypothetical protein AHF37_00019 [Paragonimus kellicotti]|nr:hypothetical protein AHF37_00019 [Paragonimus kellicotti]
MIPCQQALMLNSAMAFERLIKSPKAQLRLEPGKREDVSITWDQTEEVEWYINQLQNASRQLMTENRRLRKVHFTILEKINRLFEIDLLRYQQRWRNELAEVRYMLAEVTNQGGYPVDHMAPWRAHLDRQFYKVLEIQYCFGLESLSEQMPEIRVDMIYQQTRLAFRPPFEEIKAKYYREMQKFISVPNHFRGVTELRPLSEEGQTNGPTLIFPTIIENQANGLRVCYRKAEFLFTRLMASVEPFKDWVVLGSLNLDELVDSHCRELADFERNFKDLLPALKWLRGDALSQDHWHELFRLIGLPKVTKLENLTFGDLIHVGKNIVAQSESLKMLNQRAQAEVVVREALQDLDVWGAGATFALTEYVDTSGQVVHLIKNWKDIVSQVGDNLALLASLQDSPYFDSFADRVNAWAQRLADLDHALNGLQTIQRRWVYLEPILGRGALPKETARFAQVDAEFRRLLLSVKADDRVVSLVVGNRGGVLKEQLANMQDQLTRCQRALNDYLEEKRSVFPRFYFLGDDDLLEILGQSTNPAIIQTHLRKLFQGIHHIQFNNLEASTGGQARGNTAATLSAMCSLDGEVVPFRRPVQLTTDVEVWLGRLACEMKYTLSEILVQCLGESSTEGHRRNQLDPNMYPGQILTLSEAIHFARNAEQALNCGRLSTLKKELQAQLTAYASVDLHALKEMSPNELHVQQSDSFNGTHDSSPTLTRVLAAKLSALVLDTVHAIDVVDQLIRAGAATSHDWVWQRQLRFYAGTRENESSTQVPKIMSPTATACEPRIRMVDAEFAYTFEYQGNAPRLVHTPLTDKCYLTLTQAMRMGHGGNPYGPAGTGKTESVKALSSLLGRQVLVFNCDEGIDVRSMGRILVGIVKCGAWGCFDEFNRLEESVLSAVSMQIQVIQDGLRSAAPNITLLNRSISLDPNSGLFITLNPAGKGYGGRQKLPDNLKQLFRPVAMTQPDVDLIAEMILFSEGFRQARLLGRKLIRKALEVYEQTQQRMGIVLVGPSGCGKSTILSLLRMAMAKLGLAVRYHVFNPKAMLRVQLLGRIDPDTREWTDGVLTYSARCVVKEDVDQRCWIVCDGDIDPEWVESLNSVLDDNRLLTLPSGERIQFGPNVNFLFETHELTQASPATVSRMGVVYVSEEAMEPRALVDAWLAQQPEEDRAKLNTLIDPAFYTCLDWVYQKNDFVVETSPAATLFNGLSHLIGATTPARLTVGLIRGLGANLTDSAREALAIQVYEATGENPPDPTRPLDVQVDTNYPGRLIPYPPSTSVVVLGPNAGGNTNPVPCTEFSSANITSDLQLARAAANAVASGHPPLVLTPDVRRAVDAFRCWLDEPRARQSFLLVGPEGCGKSRLLDYCFATSPRPVQVATVHCSAQTTPAQLLEKLAQCCITVTCSTASTTASRVLRPREGERLILYLRDLNLPKPDKWGSCQLTAFLQQLLTYHGYYDPTSLEFIGIEGIQFVGSFTPAASSAGFGRHHLSPRFTSALRLTVITYPGKDQLVAIYACLLQAVVMSHLSVEELPVAPPRSAVSHATTQPQHPFKPSTNLINPVRLHTMATIMVQLLSAVQQQFRADEHAHCVFTPHILTAWVASLLRYELHGSVNTMWAAFGQEARRLFRDRLPGEQARRSTTSGHDVVEGVIHQVGWFVTWGAAQSVQCGGPMQLNGHHLGFMPSSAVEEVIARGLAQLSREHCPRAADLVLFPEFVDLICRVDRALSCPGGSLLLAGRSGIGRRSAVNLVAHLHQLNLCHLRVGRDYSIRQFVTDIKAACQMAGLDSQPTLLLIEDHQLVEDSFLEVINSLLACGEASGLFTTDELETLASTVTTNNSTGVSLREAAAEAGHRGPLSTFFADRVRTNLHIVIVLDIDNIDQFTARLRSNPSLYKHSCIQWLDSWTRTSMLQLPRLLVPGVSQLAKSDLFSQAFVAVHNSAPQPSLATPRRYLALCAAYARIEKTRRDKLEAQASRLQAGLAKLKEARRRVSQLKKSAAEQGKQLTEKQAAADTALEQISAAMQGAADQRSEMEALRNRAADESKDLERRKAVIDTELAEIEPLVQQARAAVGNIRPEALSEIRALRAPPDTIRDILEGVLLLMGIRDTSWTSMRGFLAKRGVQEEILNFDARRISPELRTSVERLLSKNQDSFDPKMARRASVAAAPLATWVRANVKYAVVLERIAPLEKEQAQLRSSLTEGEDALKRLADDLADVDVQVAGLRAVFEQHTSEATRLKVELDRARDTLASAEALVGELEVEHARWKKQVNELSIELAALPTLALLSAAFITYLAASPEDVRQRQLADWVTQFAELGLNLPDSSCCVQSTPSIDSGSRITDQKRFDICRFLTTEREQLFWRTQGLPSDQLSGENAVVILETSMCPFIVDPSSRSLNWLRLHLKHKKVEVVNQQVSGGLFATTLELAVRFGKSLIVQEVEEIEPILFPLLSKNLVSQGSRSTVTLGDRTVDFHPEFRLFLCTRQTPSTLGTVKPASAASLVTVVNFVTTRAGLVGQLLATSLHHERPELEQRRQELVRAEENMRLELAKLEDDLLQELANAHGNILENKELLQSLNKTKQSSMTIAESLVESTRLQLELDKERDVFHPLAEAGSRVYFALTDLVKINWMYQFSLNSFLRLFQKALEAPRDSTLNTPDRMIFLQKRLEALTYAHVSQALFKADRLMFTMHLTRCLRPEAITDEEWQFFIGLTGLDTPVDSVPASHWVGPERIREVMRLKVALPNLYTSLRLDDSRVWADWMRNTQTDAVHTPIGLQADPPTAFQLNVLAVQTIRPDRLYTALRQFANRCLDLPNLGSPTLNLYRLYETETRATEPILLLISPGADPSQELAEAAAMRFAGKAGTTPDTCSSYRQVAMGQGQADLALRELHEAAEVVLEKEINALVLSTEEPDVATTDENPKARSAAGNGRRRVHEGFRLWLTAEPHAGFPSALLQTCLKVSYEAPPGLKRNLRRTYESWTRPYLAQGNSSTRATALITLAWFHAVVQERRSYIPQFYEFSYADLRVAADIIDRLLLDTSSKGPVKDVWSWIHGLFADAIYGGRMDNDFDSEVLRSYLVQMFSDETVRNLRLGPLRLPGTTELRHCSSNKCEGLLKSANKPTTDSNAGQSCGDSFPFGVCSESPVVEFLRLELRNALHLIHTVHTGLAGLSRACRGTQFVTAALHKLAESLLHGETPSCWLSEWPEGPEEPIPFLRDLVAKASAVQNWMALAEANQLIQTNSAALDLADLFRPSTFLNAIRQQTARQLGVSIDSLKLTSYWPHQSSQAPVYGSRYLPVRIAKLKLEGANFESGRLAPSQPESPSLIHLPDVTLVWTEQDKPECICPEESICLPVYLNHARQYLVSRLHIPCPVGTKNQWIQAGTALLLTAF